MVWKKIVNEERTWSFGPGGSRSSSNWMGGGSDGRDQRTSFRSNDGYPRAKANVDRVVSGGRIRIEDLNLTNTRHQEYDRRDRDASIDNEAGGLGREVLAVYFVDKGHPAGPELHWITDNAIILVTNAFKNNGLNVNTKLTARAAQLYRYPEGGSQNMLECRQIFPDRDWHVPSGLVEKAKRNQEMGLNYRESSETRTDYQFKVQFEGDEPLMRSFGKDKMLCKTEMNKAISRYARMLGGDCEGDWADDDTYQFYDRYTGDVVLTIEYVEEDVDILDESRMDDAELLEFAREYINARHAKDRGDKGAERRERMAFDRLENFVGGMGSRFMSESKSAATDIMKRIDEYVNALTDIERGDRTAGMAANIARTKIDRLVENSGIKATEFYPMLSKYAEEYVESRITGGPARMGARVVYEHLLDYVFKFA